MMTIGISEVLIIVCVALLLLAPVYCITRLLSRKV
jgi:hypothetical protein